MYDLFRSIQGLALVFGFRDLEYLHVDCAAIILKGTNKSTTNTTMQLFGADPGGFAAAWMGHLAKAEKLLFVWLPQEWFQVFLTILLMLSKDFQEGWGRRTRCHRGKVWQVDTRLPGYTQDTPPVLREGAAEGEGTREGKGAGKGEGEAYGEGEGEGEGEGRSTRKFGQLLRGCRCIPRGHHAGREIARAGAKGKEAEDDQEAC